MHRQSVCTITYGGLTNRTALEKPWAPYVPTLKDMCVKVVAQDFLNNPTFGGFDKDIVKRITDLLPVDLPLELAGTLIADEGYWRRRASEQWKNIDVRMHGGSYKQCFFERTVTQALESFDPEISPLEDLRRLLAYSRPFVRTISVAQLPSHIDLRELFRHCISDLVALRLSYGALHCGMDYERSLFGMTLADVRSLSGQLPHAETLTTLDLCNSVIDDEKVRALVKGLDENSSVTSLNLSHNRLADRAARALAKLLDGRSCLAHLDLSDNSIHTEGGRALARALRHGASLVSLNLKLNRLGDRGGQDMMDSLAHNTTLQRLNIGANGLGLQSGVALSGLLLANSTLLEIDVSANEIGAEVAPMIRDAATRNGTVRNLDVRNCQLGEELEESIGEVARLNAQAASEAGAALGMLGTITNLKAFRLSKTSYVATHQAAHHAA